MIFLCGIFGYIGDKNASQVLVQGLLRLEYRGYDSSGIVVRNGSLQSFKDVGKISDLTSSLPKMEGTIGISHTRWATHGPKTNINSHPHLSQSGNFVLVHNGIIENYLELKKELKKNDIKCISETDTEVIVNMIELNYLIEKNVEKAIEKTLSQSNRFDLDNERESRFRRTKIYA